MGAPAQAVRSACAAGIAAVLVTAALSPASAFAQTAEGAATRETDAAAARPISQASAAPSCPHVRPVGFDPLAAARLIEEATRRSQTVRSLVDALDRSDVIVLVELVPTLPHPSGRTTLQGATPTVRYVRVTIASSNPLYDQIKWLAHELTHAWEIAEAPDVRDAVGLQRLMLRICSMSNVAGTRFETARAVAAGRKALAEASAMPVLTLAPRIP